MQNYKEIWKDIPNYEGLYQVSNLGRVRSLYNKGRVLKPRKHRNGYQEVNLSKRKIIKTKLIHRLVMLVFIGESDLQVNHINGIKTDNRLENLEYCTSRDNIRHAHKIGLSNTKGQNNGRAKLTEFEAKQIKYGHKGWKQKDIANMYGLSRDQIRLIRTGKTWKHI